jgi:hypothetical protein
MKKVCPKLCDIKLNKIGVVKLITKFNIYQTKYFIYKQIIIDLNVIMQLLVTVLIGDEMINALKRVKILITLGILANTFYITSILAKQSTQKQATSVSDTDRKELMDFSNNPYKYTSKSNWEDLQVINGRLVDEDDVEYKIKSVILSWSDSDIALKYFNMKKDEDYPDFEAWKISLTDEGMEVYKSFSDEQQTVIFKNLASPLIQIGFWRVSFTDKNDTEIASAFLDYQGFLNIEESLYSDVNNQMDKAQKLENTASDPSVPQMHQEEDIISSTFQQPQKNAGSNAAGALSK